MSNKQQMIDVDASKDYETGLSVEGEVVLSAVNIVQAEEFEIGHEVTDTSGMPVDELSMWPSGSASRQSLVINKRGRGRVKSSHNVHTVNLRRQPHRESRVKSFKHLFECSSENDEEVGVEESSMITSNATPSRVFVTNEIPGMHLEWPLFSQQAEGFAVAAHIIVTEAASVRTSQICTSIPQEFTEVGTFVIDTSDLRNRHEATLDGLGSWGSPQGSIKYYRINYSTHKVVLSSSNDYSVKVHCSRYVHPGTDERGRFIKKIYYDYVSGSGESSLYVVLTYDWEGTPHPVAVVLGNIPHAGALKERPFGSRSWEAQNIDLSIDEGIFYRGQPIFSKLAIDFDSACKILLAGFVINAHRICIHAPVQYKESGTFVLDAQRCGGEKAIHKDGRDWTKPSGSSRFFRFDPDGNAVRVDRAGASHPPPDEDFDVQVIAKRYETEQLPGLVRKIFVAREKEGHRVNSHLAVVTYFWKGEPAIAQVRKAVPLKNFSSSRKWHVSSMKDDDVVSPSTISLTQGDAADKIRRPRVFLSQSVENPLSRMMLSHSDHLKRLVLAKQIENQNKMCLLLDRAENFLERFEQFIPSWEETNVSGDIVMGDNEDRCHDATHGIMVTENGDQIQVSPSYQFRYEH